MPVAPVNGIEICYETLGRDSDPAVLLIRGLGGQMIAWREDFCAQLAGRGFHVIRFDNRDVGMSTKIEPGAFPSLDPARPYSLEDMAEDAMGLLDHLEVYAAHVVGMSMGGMIAQVMAIRFPGRVLSLTSIASHIGGEDVVPPAPEALSIFIGPPQQTREEAIAKALSDRRIIGSPGFPFDEDDVRDVAGRSWDRGDFPPGRMRQIAAASSAPGRREALERLRIPTLVVHGTDDPLVPIENGRRTAAAVPHSELLVIEGMGHDIPRGVWDRIIDATDRLARRAAAPSQA